MTPEQIKAAYYKHVLGVYGGVPGMTLEAFTKAVHDLNMEKDMEKHV